MVQLGNEVYDETAGGLTAGGTVPEREKPQLLL
jgi:hypothetical protein